MKFYSPSSRGFYDSEIHTASPADAIAITDDVYRALFEAQASGKVIVPDENGNPIAVDVPIPGPSVATQLLQIDAKKIRALTDALLTGDNTRLTQLEQQAALLRPHVGADNG